MSGLFGGRSSSTATKTSTSQVDNRSIVDAGSGIAGSGNSVDKSSRWSYDAYTADNSQRFTDNSDRSSRSSFADSRDQRVTDNSDRSSRSSYSSDS